MSQLIDCIFVSTEPYTEQGRRDPTPEECYRFCKEVSLYAERAMGFGFRDHEMPKPLIHVHRATEVVYRSEAIDDLEDFLKHIEWSKVVVEETIEALEVIGANDHARFLAAVHNYLKRLGYKIDPSNMDPIRDAIAKAAKRHISAAVLQKSYGNFGVSGDDDLDRRWRSICLQTVRYMDSWTNFKRIPDGPYNQAELKKYFESRLELARSRKGVEQESAHPGRTTIVSSLQKLFRSTTPVASQPPASEYANVIEVRDARAFVTAARDGDVEAVRNMLANGVNVEARINHQTESLPNGATSLMAAAAEGHLEIVKLLLAAGADVNTHATKYRETALILAAREGRLDVVKTLLSAKAKANAKMEGGRTALIEASEKLHVEIVEALIAAGADVNGKPARYGTALASACMRLLDKSSLSETEIDQSGSIEVARVLIAAGADVNDRDSEGWTPLIKASRSGLSEVVKDLLAAGADLNARTDHGFTAFALALSWKRPETARLLLAAGADVHAATKTGQTALMAASDYGYMELMQALLDAGVDVNAKDERGFSALMGAARGGHLQAVELLLAAKADANAVTKHGRTALSLAAMNGHLDVVRALVAANADINVKTNDDGTTALTIAAQKGHQEVVKFLESLQPRG